MIPSKKIIKDYNEGVMPPKNEIELNQMFQLIIQLVNVEYWQFRRPVRRFLKKEI